MNITELSKYYTRELERRIPKFEVLTRMKRILQFVTIGMMLIISSCSNKNLIEYYYPINQQKEVKIYKYVNPLDQALTEYWKTTTNPIRKTILTESYNSKFELYNSFEEKVYKDRAELFEYIDYEKDKEIQAEVIKSMVYNTSKSMPYSYQVKYLDKYGWITFEKKRQFVDFEEVDIQGKNYKTAKFKDEYYINVIDQNEMYEFSQTTFYSKGIGMVKYERYLPNGEIRVLELAKILTENEFNSIKKQIKR